MKERDRVTIDLVEGCGYCRDCKWWEAPKPRQPEANVKLEAILARIDWTFGSCGRIVNCVEENNGVLAEMRSNDGSDLYTKPNFGCVQFERTEAAAKEKP